MSGPQDGHQFHFTVHLQPSYGVVGEPLRDAETPSPDSFRVTVRAWNLRDACLAAGSVGLNDWAQVDEAEHKIHLRESGWTILHPLSCRPNLFDCPVTKAAQEMPTPLPQYGIFECWLDDNGQIVIGDRA